MAGWGQERGLPWMGQLHSRHNTGGRLTRHTATHTCGPGLQPSQRELVSHHPLLLFVLDLSRHAHKPPARAGVEPLPPPELLKCKAPGMGGARLTHPQRLRRRLPGQQLVQAPQLDGLAVQHAALSGGGAAVCVRGCEGTKARGRVAA